MAMLKVTNVVQSTRAIKTSLYSIGVQTYPFKRPLDHKSMLVRRSVFQLALFD